MILTIFDAKGLKVCGLDVCRLYSLGDCLTQTTTPFNKGHQSRGQGRSPKYVVGYTNVDIPPKVSARGVDIVHMVLWHNAIIVAFSSESDSADNTELRHILSNSEEIRSGA